jgi:hypothetical protein
LGPKLFLLYINDLPEVIQSNVSLFADDTMIYRQVINISDGLALQQDINAIDKWSKEWHMPFNVSKTKLIKFGKQYTDDTNANSYELQGESITEVEQVKYLGITLNNKLNFNEHIQGKINKAMQILGMLRRTLWFAPRKTKRLAYISLCRPILEYGSAVWDPHNKNTVHELEMVQNKAIRFIANLKGRYDSITDAREKVGLEPLETRRKNARLRMLINMLENKNPVLGDFLDEQATNQHQHSTRSHAQHLLQSITTNTNTFYFSFLPRTIRDLRLEEQSTRVTP